MTTKTKAKKVKAEKKVQVQAVQASSNGGIEAAIGAANDKPTIAKVRKAKPTEEQVMRNHAVVRGDTKKSQPISTRLPEVTVEYDFKKDGKVERRQKTFQDANEAKRFFLEKDIKEKNPEVLKVQPEAQAEKPEKLRRISAGTWTTVECDGQKNTYATRAEAETVVAALRETGPKGKAITIRMATLAEAFPMDKPPEGYKPALQATGDPTTTQLDLTGDKPYALVPDQLTPEQQKAEAKKAAKRLKRKQKKGELLWRTKDTKTVVSAKWQKPQGAFYDRWLIKYDDGTETLTNQLSVIYSREHLDHHLRIAGVPAIDGLSNKQYEEVLRRSAEYAQQRANYYASSLTNFRGTAVVQKEMDKRISKKALKQEQPFTPEELLLAKKLAETANYYCCSPSAFFATEEQRLKSPHTAKLTNHVVDTILSNAGIDRLQVSIRILQFAKNLHNQMTARLQVGGPQIGTPELAKEAEAEAKAAAKLPRSEKVVVEGEAAAAPKPSKSKEDVDTFGNKPSTGCGIINAVILALPKGKVFTVELIKNKTGMGHAGSHLRTLCIKGHVEKCEGGFRVAGTSTAAAAESKPTKGTKAAKPAKAKKAAAKPAGKAKAGKGKAARKGKRG